MSNSYNHIVEELVQTIACSIWTGIESKHERSIVDTDTAILMFFQKNILRMKLLVFLQHLEGS